MSRSGSGIHERAVAALQRNSTTERLAASIVSVSRQMNELGLNQGTSGNVSARSGDGFLITPSGKAYDSLAPQDIVLMRMDGTVDGAGTPSSEWRMHRDIYAARDEANSVLHVHPTYCTALASLRQEIPSFHYMVAVAGGTDIRCADYATFGTQALSDAMMNALAGRRACLLANHGMICFAGDVEGALDLGIEIEVLARQYCEARKIGDPILLSTEEMTEVLERFGSYGSARPSA